MAHHGGENIFDTTVDAALVSQRNDQRQQQLDQLAEQNKKNWPTNKTCNKEVEGCPKEQSQ